jgi:outer membrane immunogenic protein
MHRIIRAAFTVTAALVLPFAARAADLPFKAPPPPAPTWTGFYLGGNVGLGIARDPTTDTGVFAVPSIPATATPWNESLMHSPLGMIGGGQIGYNAQFNQNFVLGVEADWQWSSQKDTICTYTCGSNSVAVFNLGGAGDSTSLKDTQQLRWLSTARLRAGYATNSWLWYLTGGAAYGRVEESFLYNTSFIPGPPNPYPPGPASASFAQNRLGWTAGAGVETQLVGNWSAKIEYLFVDLGGITDTWVIRAPLFGIPTLPSSLTNTSSFHFDDHIIRVGLNYRFNGGRY